MCKRSKALKINTWRKDNTVNETHVIPHFHHTWFGKCCHPFTYIGGPKGRNSLPQNRTFYFGEPS